MSNISYYENGIPYYDNGSAGMDIVDRFSFHSDMSFVPFTPEIPSGMGPIEYARPHLTLTDGAMYAPDGGISALDVINGWAADGTKGMCPSCSRKECPFIGYELKSVFKHLNQYRHHPHAVKIALSKSPHNFTRPLLTLKNLFNSTAPVVMSHLSRLEGKRFDSTKDNLNGLFKDRCLLERSIASFRHLSSNAQTALQIFSYGNECRDPKYNNFYHHMGSVNGTGRGSSFAGRNYDLAMKELYNNMKPTLKNVFVLDRLVKEFDNSVSPYIKEVGQLARDFLTSTGSNSHSTDIVKNQYDYWFFPGKGDKSNFLRDVQHWMFAAGNAKTALQIGGISNGSTNISTNAHRFATQGDGDTYPKSVLQWHDSNAGDQVGAFRHPLWQAAITARFGEDVASRVADAHERYRTLDLNIRQFSKRSDADQTVDMLNNREGREIGKRTPGVSMKVQAYAVLDHFHKEGFYVIKENASGFAVEKERITDEQFHYMKGQYDRGDDHGFSPEQIAEGKKNEILAKFYP